MDWGELFASLLVGSFFAFFSIGFIGTMAEIHQNGQSRTLDWLEYFIYVITYPFYVFINLLERVLPGKKIILWGLFWIVYFYLGFTGTLPMWLRFF